MLRKKNGIDRSSFGLESKMSQLSKILELDDLKSTQPAYLESIFSLANGHVGVRASNPINPSEDAGTIVNGFYEKSNIHYGEKAYGYAEKIKQSLNYQIYVGSIFTMRIRIDLIDLN